MSPEATLLKPLPVTNSPLVKLSEHGIERAHSQSSEIDDVFVSQVKGLLEKINAQGKDDSSALKEFYGLLDKGRLRVAMAVQKIALDQKSPDELRLAAFETLQIHELSLQEETAKALFSDKSVRSGLKVLAAGYLLQRNKDEEASKYLVSQSRSSKDGATAVQILARMENPEYTSLFLTLATNGRLPVPLRIAALGGLQGLKPLHAYDKIAPLLKIQGLVTAAAEVLVAIDPEKGLLAVSKIPQDYIGETWRKLLMLDTAYFNPKIALQILQSGIADHNDREALSQGIFNSKKIPFEEVLKLPQRELDDITAAAGFMGNTESKAFLKKILTEPEIHWRTMQIASVSLLSLGDKTELKKLMQSYVEQMNEVSQQPHAVKNTTEIIAKFLRSPGGYDALIQATQDVITDLKSKDDSQMFVGMGELIKAALIDCKEQNFSTPFRFHPVRLQRLLNENKKPTQDPQKLALVVLPASDWNGAFDDINPIIQLQSRGYAVRLCIAGTDEEAAKFIEQVKKDQRAPDVLVIGGHGSPDTLQLGISGGDASNLDLTDADILGRINASVKPETIMVLHACSTAQKLPGQSQNLFGEVRHQLKTLKENKVFGATETAYGYTFIFDKNDAVSGVKFRFLSKGGRTASD